MVNKYFHHYPPADWYLRSANLQSQNENARKIRTGIATNAVFPKGAFPARMDTGQNEAIAAGKMKVRINLMLTEYIVKGKETNSCIVPIKFCNASTFVKMIAKADRIIVRLSINTSAMIISNMNGISIQLIKFNLIIV